MFKRDCNTVPVLTKSCVLWITTDLSKVQGNTTQQDYYPLHGDIWSHHVYLYYVLWCYELTHWQSTNHCACAVNTTMNNIPQLKTSSDVASTGYKNHCTCCSLTLWQLHKLQLSHIKLFHSTGAGRTRMKLAKVVIACALVFAACAEGWSTERTHLCSLYQIEDITLLNNR